MCAIGKMFMPDGVWKGILRKAEQGGRKAE
jgi:hypothetical protein